MEGRAGGCVPWCESCRRGSGFLVVASFWIVTLMIQEGQSCVGPPATSSLNQGPNQDSHPEQGGGGLRTWVPKAQEFPRAILLGVWGLPSQQDLKASKGSGRGVSRPQITPPVRPMGCAVHGDTGSRWGQLPEGLQGGSCVILEPSPASGPWHLPTGPAPEPVSISIPQFYGRTPGALWAARHPCYGDRQCVSHECVSMRLAGMK